MTTETSVSDRNARLGHRVCVACVMDTSDPDITFDDDGVCNHCKRYPEHLRTLGDERERAGKLDGIVETLRRSGRNSDYDCIMGLSGGVDSSYLAYLAVRELDLRPLVVHVDSGWNSELAVSNIEHLCKNLELDLHTLVIDWSEMRDLQLAFFRAGVANLDVPQDHAFNAAMLSEARKFGVKSVLNGGNMQTESILPKAWGYDASDPKHLRSIHKAYGSLPLRSYPVRSDLDRLIVDPFVRRMKVYRPLEFVEYDKTSAKTLLQTELGWRDYGGKHYESRFTKFFQAYYLPTKFGFDKRKAHLSSLIASGQLTRADALVELSRPLYDERELEQDIAYFCKKLGLSRAEFDSVMVEEPRTFQAFPNREQTYKVFSAMLRVAGKAGRTVRRH